MIVNCALYCSRYWIVCLFVCAFVCADVWLIICACVCACDCCCGCSLNSTNVLCVGVLASGTLMLYFSFVGVTKLSCFDSCNNCFCMRSVIWLLFFICSSLLSLPNSCFNFFGFNRFTLDIKLNHK